MIVAGEFTVTAPRQQVFRVLRGANPFIRFIDELGGLKEIDGTHDEAMFETKIASMKVTTGSADDWPALGVAVTIDGDGAAIRSTRIVASAATNKATRLRSADAVLESRDITDALLKEAGETALEDVGFVSDSRGSVPCRRELVRVYVRRAVCTVLDGSGVC